MRLYLPDGMLKRPNADLSDITRSKIVGRPYWDGDWAIFPFDKEPTKAEQDRIRRRLVTVDAADEARLEALSTDRKAAKTKVEKIVLDTELAKYGEPTTPA